MSTYEIFFWLMLFFYWIQQFINSKNRKKQQKLNAEILSYKDRTIASLIRQNQLQAAKIDFLEKIRRYPNANYN
jgi:hypothetical protein